RLSRGPGSALLHPGYMYQFATRLEKPREVGVELDSFSAMDKDSCLICRRTQSTYLSLSGYVLGELIKNDLH
ncbi:TPA: hypothetical protein ACTXXA_002928, partial [Legionella anisa]